jgi:ABC-type Zn uptake system ZnuABC Zn-binding protein ZnuA
MNANELADMAENACCAYQKEIATMLRQQQAKIDKYEQVLNSIANEYVELSHDKIKWQCGDHIRWAKGALK